jgi:thiol-disulfide isomerase/thioredoxin
MNSYFNFYSSMKNYIFLLLVLGNCQGIYAQKIQKVNVEALTEYIEKADHPVVVNFWATWCSPCTHELPYFESNIKKYEEQKIELILVSLDFAFDYPKKIADFLKKNHYQGSYFWLDETNADHFCPKVDEKWSGAIPASLFYNPKTGHRSFFERQLTEPQLINELKALVSQ